MGLDRDRYYVEKLARDKSTNQPRHLFYPAVRVRADLQPRLDNKTERITVHHGKHRSLRLARSVHPPLVSVKASTLSAQKDQVRSKEKKSVGQRDVTNQTGAAFRPGELSCTSSCLQYVYRSHPIRREERSAQACAPFPQVQAHFSVEHRRRVQHSTVAHGKGAYGSARARPSQDTFGQDCAPEPGRKRAPVRRGGQDRRRTGRPGRTARWPWLRVRVKDRVETESVCQQITRRVASSSVLVHACMATSRQNPSCRSLVLGHEHELT